MSVFASLASLKKVQKVVAKLENVKISLKDVKLVLRDYLTTDRLNELFNSVNVVDVAKLCKDFDMFNYVKFTKEKLENLKNFCAALDLADFYDANQTILYTKLYTEPDSYAHFVLLVTELDKTLVEQESKKSLVENKIHKLFKLVEGDRNTIDKHEFVLFLKNIKNYLSEETQAHLQLIEYKLADERTKEEQVLIKTSIDIQCISDTDIDVMFAQFDANNSGTITYNEFYNTLCTEKDENAATFDEIHGKMETMVLLAK